MIRQIVSKRKDLFAITLILLIYFVFNMLLVGTFFPITEGWFQDFSNYINSGDVLYKDIYMFVTPGFPLLSALLSKFANNSFIALRYFGIAERLLMITLAYYLLRKIFKTEIVFVSLLVSSIVYISNIQDVFYGYYQSSLFIGLISLSLFINAYEQFTINYKKSLMFSYLFGISAIVSFLFKQTLSVVLTFALISLFMLCTFRINIKKALKCIFFMAGGILTAICIFVLALLIQGSFVQFIQQVFGGASSKGSIVSVLFSFIPRLISTNMFLIFIVLFIYIIIMLRIEYLKKHQLVYDKFYNVIQWSLLIIIAIIFYNINLKGFTNVDHTLPYSTFAKFFFTFSFLSIGICSFLFFLNKSIFKISAKVIRFSSAIAIVIILLLNFYYISTRRIGYHDFVTIREWRQYLSYAVFFIEIIYSCVLLYFVTIKKKNEYAIELFIVVSAWAIMYVHGFSAIIEDHSMLISLAVIIGLFLRHEIKGNALKNCLICLMGFMMIFAIFSQRAMFPYQWWCTGWSPSIYDATETFDDPLLKGIKSNKSTVEPMNEIYHYFMNNKKDSDTLYTFPSINYFSVMSGLKSHTFAKVHYFDVCSDQQAISDAKILMQDPPTYIMWLDLPQSVWEAHEAIFRSGNPSGQRELEKTYKDLVNSGKYNLVGIYKIGQSDPIYLWKLK